MRVTVDYGFACGRHWMSINGKVISQTDGDDVYLRDEDVVHLVKGTIGAPEWVAPTAGDRQAWRTHCD